MMSVAKKAINAIAKIHGTHYQLGPVADLMYPTSGRTCFSVAYYNGFSLFLIKNIRF
jgi:hypothetical protein